MWLDASTIVGLNNGDSIVTWPDESGNGYDATPFSPAPTYQTNVVNSLPVVRFNGGQDLASNYPTNTKPFTMFAVVNLTDVATYRTIIGSAGTGGVHWRVNSGTAMANIDKDAVAGIGTATSATPVGSWTLIAVTYSGTGTYTFYVDGVAAGTGTNDVAFTADTAIIGDNGSGSQRWLGDIAEIICYDSVLSADDRQDVEAYANSKYAI